jgi:threonylcarbamoyladenosine tRNA methylthiotransferase MtaB
MRRRYNAEMALTSIKKMRSAVPEATFSADIIVGFPGESDENFRETMEFCRAARFLHMHIFPYSKRAGTEAAEMKGQIAGNIKRERLHELESLGREIKGELLENYVNSHKDAPVYVLAEKCEGGSSFGHSEHFVEVKITNTEADAGEIIPVYLESTDGQTVTGHAK